MEIRSFPQHLVSTVIFMSNLLCLICTSLYFLTLFIPPNGIYVCTRGFFSTLKQTLYQKLFGIFVELGYLGGSRGRGGEEALAVCLLCLGL